PDWGSVGPLPLHPVTRAAFQRLGGALASEFQLRGLFGVDCILRDGVPWPVEVNPRYPASVEVLEHAGNLCALALHRRVFETAEPPTPILASTSATVVGKAVLFARARLMFPRSGPWSSLPKNPPPTTELSAFADIPRPGSTTARGQPILTLFARGDSMSSCLLCLQETAAQLESILYR